MGPPTVLQNNGVLLLGPPKRAHNVFQPRFTVRGSRSGMQISLGKMHVTNEIVKENNPGDCIHHLIKAPSSNQPHHHRQRGPTCQQEVLYHYLVYDCITYCEFRWRLLLGRTYHQHHANRSLQITSFWQIPTDGYTCCMTRGMLHLGN